MIYHRPISHVVQISTSLLIITTITQLYLNFNADCWSVWSIFRQTPIAVSISDKTKVWQHHGRLCGRINGSTTIRTQEVTFLCPNFYNIKRTFSLMRQVSLVFFQQHLIETLKYELFSVFFLNYKMNGLIFIRSLQRYKLDIRQ